MTTKYSNAAARAVLAARVAQFNGGSIKFFTGAAPATCETADSGTLLGMLTFGATAFALAAASAGVSPVATANAITSDTSADASGTAGYYRAYDSGGVCIQQGTLGTSGADINLVTTTIVTGQPIAITGWTITEPL